jgi:hypothetical protein
MESPIVLGGRAPTGLYIYCSPSHTDATSLPLLNRDAPARAPLALPAQELRRQPTSTRPIDHLNPLHFTSTQLTKQLFCMLLDMPRALQRGRLIYPMTGPGQFFILGYNGVRALRPGSC